MSTKPAFTRRAIALVLAGFVVPGIASQVAERESATTFAIDPAGIKTLRDLIGAMKTAAGPLLPPSIPLRAYYEAISAAFVEHAHAAAAAGIKGIPPKLLEKIPRRRVAFPILVTVVIAGVTFLVPLATLVWTVIGSLTVLTVYILRAIDAVTRDKPLKA